MTFSPLSRATDCLLALDGADGPAIRALLVRTLIDDDLMSLSALTWTQLCWVVVMVTTGSLWLLVPMIADLLLFAVRWRFRRQVNRADATASDLNERFVVLVNLLWIALIAAETVVLLGLPSVRALVLGIALPVGFIGYVVSLFTGFPRLAATAVAVLAAALTVGLASSAFDELHVFSLLTPGGAVAFVILIRRTHASLIGSVRAQHQNYLKAMHDALTGLPNRLLMLDRLRRSCATARREPGWAAPGVLCLDLDGFKAVNDRFGHAAGDALLVRLARVLRAAVRPGDTVCRRSGDEFVVILPAIDEVGIRGVAERIVAAVARPIDIGLANPVQVGVSVGVARGGPNGTTAEDLLARGDAALYDAKRGGKGRFRVAS